jgi:hypothetical protein
LAIHENYSFDVASCQSLIIPDSVHTFQLTGYNARPPERIPDTVKHLIFGCRYDDPDPLLITSRSLQSLTYLGFNVDEYLGRRGLLLTDQQSLIDIARRHIEHEDRLFVFDRTEIPSSLPNIQQCTSLKTVFLYGQTTDPLPEGVENVTIVMRDRPQRPSYVPRSVKRISWLMGGTMLASRKGTEFKPWSIMTTILPEHIQTSAIEGNVVVQREQ